MKKNISGIIAVVLALAMVVSVGIYARDSRLKASDENVYDETSDAGKPATDVQEIIIETQPTETPAVEEAAEIPAEVPAEEPAEAPAEEPAEAPAEEPAEAPAEEPAEAPAEEPAEALAEEPAEVSVEEPAEVPAEEPAEAPAEEPAEVPEEELTEEPKEEPAEEAVEEPEEEEERELRVWVTTSLDGVETVESGTEITLTAHLEGFEGLSYRLQWQRSLDGIHWEDEPNATSETYRFILTDENDDYIWRIMVYPA